MPAAVHTELKALAEQRDCGVGELVSSFIAYELDEQVRRRRERPEEALDQLLFMATGVESLLTVHPNRELRTQVLKIWRDRLEAESRTDARA